MMGPVRACGKGILQSRRETTAILEEGTHAEMNMPGVVRHGATFYHDLIDELIESGL